MSSLEKLTTLSDTITKNTKILTDHLSSKGLEAPSFAIDGLIEFPITSSEEVPWRAREELIRDTLELHDLVVGPREGLRGLGWDVSLYFPTFFWLMLGVFSFRFWKLHTYCSYSPCPKLTISSNSFKSYRLSYQDTSQANINQQSVNSLSLQTVYDFKVAEHVPVDGSTISYAELAEKSGVPVLKLRPLVRHAIMNRIFWEPVRGFGVFLPFSIIFTHPPPTDMYCPILDSS